jgi:adenine-specific DNA-methyltransferase
MKQIKPNDSETRSADPIAMNLERLKTLFPEAFVEGKVDFEVLKQLLGGALDPREEKFGLNWHGKRMARQLALTPSTGTLRPCPEESVEWDKTQNLMIEGDNLEVLKLLQKSYAGKVKLIYIDPPYNTAGDFVYPDDFRDNIRNYLIRSGQSASDGRKTTTTSESSGRLHTDWLNLMYPRLKLARDLLRDDGVILISIDEHEFTHLRPVLLELFGAENAIGTIIWKGATDNNPTQIAMEHEYLLCFARSKASVASTWKNSDDAAKQVLLQEYSRLRQLPHLTDLDVQAKLRTFIKANREALSSITHYDRVDTRGIYTGSRKVHNPKPGGYTYDVVHPATRKPCVPPVNGYRYPKTGMDALIAADRILYGEDESQIVQVKEYLDDYQGRLSSVISLDSRAGANELNDLFGVQKLFSNPKPVSLLQSLFEFMTASGDLVMDFFAGSGTTAHAVWRLNVQDGGRRQFVLVQLPELLDPNRKEQKVAADYCTQLGRPLTIAELTKERLRRVGKAIKSEVALFSGDLGFRVFKLDSSNIRAWDPSNSHAQQDLDKTLFGSIEHVQPDRTESDILYELLLKRGLDLCVPIVTRQLAGKQVHSIGAGTMVACLDKKVSRADVEPLALGIAAWHKELAPAGEVTVVFRDSAFVDDVAKSNLAAILQQHGLANVRSL